MSSLCRDCCAILPDTATACPECRPGRVVAHRELFSLTIAHVDCDAFYASVEKRDRPELASKPVIVGGGKRGVVTAACYVARMYGVKSAMPMFKALKACPDAVVIRPDFEKYTKASRAVRALMNQLTPLVLPLSIDEAVLDLAGTEALHGAPPAVVLARFARRVEREVGITVSIGLAGNRLMGKIAAGRNKPRGFAVIGVEEARAFLAGEPVRLLPGIGPGTGAQTGNSGHHPAGALAGVERSRRRQETWHRRPHSGAPRAGRGRARRQSWARNEIGQRRNDLRDGPDVDPGS